NFSEQHKECWLTKEHRESANINFVDLVQTNNLFLEHNQFVFFSDQQFAMNRDEINGEQDILDFILHNRNIEHLCHQIRRYRKVPQVF
ncbi:hypothetical protein PENTCL1PPCAC_13186, partial [Pristionchus entomophagus]